LTWLGQSAFSLPFAKIQDLFIPFINNFKAGLSLVWDTNNFKARVSLVWDTVPSQNSRASLKDRASRRPLVLSLGHLAYMWEKARSYPHRNPGRSWRWLSLCRSLPLMLAFILWSLSFSLMCPWYKCFCFIQKENQGW